MNPFLLPFVHQKQQQQQRELAFAHQQQQQQLSRDFSFVQQGQPPRNHPFVQQLQQQPRDLRLLQQKQKQPPPKVHSVPQQPPKDHNSLSHHDKFSSRTDDSKSPAKSKPKPNEHERMKERPRGPKLPRTYQFTDRDVCCGRGKKNWNLPGNTVYRDFIQDRVGRYISANSKREKTMYISDLVQELRAEGYQFLKEDQDGLLYDMGDREAREKIAHCLRDQVTAIRQKKKDLAQFSEAKARLRAQGRGPASFRSQQPHFPKEKESHVFPEHQPQTSSIMGRPARTSEHQETVQYVDYWILLE